jgi:pimeloyl-ACP methyl ester carboxylesterase
MADERHIEAGGIRYWCTVSGAGEPLLLLHGGLGSFDMFAPVLPILGEGRTVIGIDLLGHGRTELGSRSVNLIEMGDDSATVLRELGLGQVDVLGYSLGAGVALQLAARHPELVRRLVLASAPYSSDGFYPEMRPMQAQVGAAMLEFMKDTPMYTSYVAVAPHPEDFGRLLDAMGAYMREDYDFAEDVAGLEMPVMLAFGDSDMVSMDHVVAFYKLLGGARRDAGWGREHMARNRLAIVPDLTHYEAFQSPAMARAVKPFLDGESGATSWAEAVAEG